MEDKKQAKLSLSTFFLILAIIIIIIMAYYIYILNNEKTNEIEKVSNLNNEISSLQNTVNSLNEKINDISNIVSDSTNSNENSNTISNTTNSNDVAKTSSNTDNSTEITKELDEDNFFYVTNFTNTSDNYTLMGIIFTPHIMSVNELEEATKKGVYTYNNKTYVIKKDYEDYDYAFFDKKNPDAVVQYAKKKDRNSYYLYGFSTADFYDYLDATDTHKYIKVSKNMPIEDINDSYTIKDFLKNYKPSKSPENNHEPDSVFTFKFTKGKCTKMILHSTMGY